MRESKGEENMKKNSVTKGNETEPDQRGSPIPDN